MPSMAAKLAAATVNRRLKLDISMTPERICLFRLSLCLRADKQTFGHRRQYFPTCGVGVNIIEQKLDHGGPRRMRAGADVRKQHDVVQAQEFRRHMRLARE